MTKETTASQPKSIGDDAQFFALIDQWRHAALCARNDAYAELVSYIDSRAPAAQAPATAIEQLQAALYDANERAAKATERYAELREVQASATIQAGQWVRCTPDLINAGVDCGHTPRRPGDGTYSHDHFIAHSAATIQEPVMVAEPVGRDGRMSDELRKMIEGMSVSVDVSTGDDDAGDRYFGTVNEVMDGYHGEKHGVVLLIQDPEPNFDLAAPMVADPAGVSAPIPMILFCPKCGKQHIDAPDARKFPAFGPGMDVAPWTNPPHRSHLCHGCGNIWRPADVATEGVAAIKTAGSNDSVAATVKAVPSEAMDEFRTCCDHPDCATCAGRGGFYRAAPLVDKTGVGK